MRLIVGLIVFLIGGVCAATAIDSSDRPQPVAFDIPAQPLAAALQAFGQATGIQVLYESSSAQEKKSVAVQGMFLPANALNVILSGTDLRPRFISREAITIALPSADNEMPPSVALGSADLSLGTLRARGSKVNDDNGNKLLDYNEVLQTDIQKALRENRLTRRGSYRAILDLWVDRTRIIRRTELYQSTGDPERDAAVKSSIQGLIISKATPPNAPLPIRIVITVKAAAT